MIEMKERLLESLLCRAVTQAADNNNSQLVSLTKKIDKTDPLLFFNASENDDRTFWMSTIDDFTLVGAGYAAKMEVDKDRFQECERQWQQIQSKAIIHNPYKTLGTGLIALGGMAFDPLKPSSNLWKNFHQNEFIIPAFILIKDKSACYLTITAEVTMEDDPLQLARKLKQKEAELFQVPGNVPKATTIIKKEEIAAGHWKDTVKYATEEIKQHLAEKIVLAREMRLKLSQEADISAVLDKLIRTQSNSYIFAFEHGTDCFVGATPERLVKLENRKLLSTCLAGTAPRGCTKDEDEKIGSSLWNDHKNRDEHSFVVRMIKNAMEQCCTNIYIPDEPVILQLKNLQHLYTPVTADLKAEYSIFDIIEKLHPTPALGGAPKQESLAFIREHELLDRGWYGAPIGWFDSNQNGEFAVAIRSGLIQGDEASLFAGCGVVEESDPDAEYEETMIKFKPMLTVLGDE